MFHRNRSLSANLYLLCLILEIYAASSYNCVHDQRSLNPTFAHVEYQNSQGRTLAEALYQPIRIIFDFSNLRATSDFQKYMQDHILPPVENYIEATFQVKRASENIKLSGQSKICDNEVSLPLSYNDAGVNADLVIFVMAKNEPSNNFIAYSGACVLDTTTKRPIFGRLIYNLAAIKPSVDEITIERDISTSLHEMTHILGFSNGLYSLFVDPSTYTTIPDPRITKTVNGQSITVMNLPTLTDRIKAYFNCPTLEGAYMEQQGGSGSVGSHFERRIFRNEVMTASITKELVVSEFTLALLEGSGWYQVNYSMAEPLTHGKGKGCDFLDTPCMKSGTAAFEEFCSTLETNQCSWTGRSGGICGTQTINTNANLDSNFDYWGNKTILRDPYADNCPMVELYQNTDCEDPINQNQAVLGSAESYARGSKCFMGTLYPGGKLSGPWSFCFKSKCQAIGNGAYKLQVSVGSTDVDCIAAGSVTVPGYGGQLTCPDPALFCTRIMNAGKCRRNCFGRGTCQNNVCKCVEGWGGPDCSMRVYADNCPKCTADSNRTSCYADACVCNPSNITCMCATGQATGDACNGSDSSTDTSKFQMFIYFGVVAIVLVGGLLIGNICRPKLVKDLKISSKIIPMPPESETRRFTGNTAGSVQFVVVDSEQVSPTLKTSAKSVVVEPEQASPTFRSHLDTESGSPMHKYLVTEATSPVSKSIIPTEIQIKSIQLDTITLNAKRER